MLGTLQHVFEIVDKVGEDATSGACLGELISLQAAEIQKAELIALGVVSCQSGRDTDAAHQRCSFF